jgi:hypothetical protein
MITGTTHLTDGGWTIQEEKFKGVEIWWKGTTWINAF